MARLTADDWTNAALDALLAEGPAAVAIQPLARELGATKGSFYWHFETRGDLLRAAVALWAQRSADDVVAAVEQAADDPAGRARELVRAVAQHGADNPGQLGLLAAVDEPDVQAALESTTQQLVDYLAKQLRGTGLSRAVAQRRATLGYAGALGHAQLASSAPSALPAGARARRAMLDDLVDVLISG